MQTGGVQTCARPSPEMEFRMPPTRPPHLCSHSRLPRGTARRAVRDSQARQRAEAGFTQALWQARVRRENWRARHCAVGVQRLAPAGSSVKRFKYFSRSTKKSALDALVGPSPQSGKQWGQPEVPKPFSISIHLKAVSLDQLLLKVPPSKSKIRLRFP